MISPGVYELDPDARLGDAVLAAAGGPLTQISHSSNLAEAVDGR